MKLFSRKILENNFHEHMFITYDKDRYVYHITSMSCVKKIEEEGFKTGEQLKVCEERKAIFFADKDVNYGIYARNKEGETYEGEEIGEVRINIKGLKLLNLSYKKNDEWINHVKYATDVTKGDLNKIPLEIDGTISYLEDGRIYEVCISKEISNKIIE